MKKQYLRPELTVFYAFDSNVLTESTDTLDPFKKDGYGDDWEEM